MVHRQQLDLLMVSRFCMQARSKLGMKVDAIRLVKDFDYAMQIFSEVQVHDGLDEDLLTACLELVNILSPEGLHPGAKEKPAVSQVSKPLNEHSRSAYVDSSKKSSDKKSFDDSEQKKSGRDLNFGPRG